MQLKIFINIYIRKKYWQNAEKILQKSFKSTQMIPDQFLNIDRKVLEIFLKVVVVESSGKVSGNYQECTRQKRPKIIHKVPGKYQESTGKLTV